MLFVRLKINKRCLPCTLLNFLIFDSGNESNAFSDFQFTSYDEVKQYKRKKNCIIFQHNFQMCFESKNFELTSSSNIIFSCVQFNNWIEFTYVTFEFYFFKKKKNNFNSHMNLSDSQSTEKSFGSVLVISMVTYKTPVQMKCILK